MSSWVEMLVAVAALLFILDQIGKHISAVIENTVKHRFAAMENLHAESFEAIEAPFELWWDDGPRETAVSKLRENMQNEMAGNLPIAIPEEVLEHLLFATSGPIIDQLRDDALHLAVHAHMKDRETALLRKLPKINGFRQHALEYRQEHEKSLDDERRQLVDFGINPVALEEFFAQRT